MFLGHYVIKIDNLIYNQLLAEALLTNEMWHYISICMKVKVGIIGKIEMKMQVSKMVYTAINSVLLLFFWEHFNGLFCAHLLQLFKTGFWGENMNSVVVILCLFLWALRQVGAGVLFENVEDWMWKWTDFLSGMPHLPARVNH